MWQVPDGDVEMTKDWTKQQTLSAAHYATLPARRRVAVQAGGHIGIFAAAFAKKFKRVLTFEPDRNNYDRLLQNVQHYDNVRFYCLGLGAEQQYVPLAHRVQNSGASYLVPKGFNVVYDDISIMAAGNVGVIALDKLNLEELDLLCLDIEGYEYYALEGARDTIARTKPVIVLEHNECAQRYGVTDKMMNDRIKALGYVASGRHERDVIYRPRA